MPSGWRKNNLRQEIQGDLHVVVIRKKQPEIFGHTKPAWFGFQHGSNCIGQQAE